MSAAFRPRECDEPMPSWFRHQERTIGSLHEKHRALTDELNRAEIDYDTRRFDLLRSLGIDSDIDLPTAALDVLARVEVEGDCWIYYGTFNNHGSATVRLREDGRSQEVSAGRWIHRVLCGEPKRGSLHPLCRSGRRCVKPAHRCHECADGKHPIIGSKRLPDVWSDIHTMEGRRAAIGKQAS